MSKFNRGSLLLASAAALIGSAQPSFAIPTPNHFYANTGIGLGMLRILEKESFTNLINPGLFPFTGGFSGKTNQLSCSILGFLGFGYQGHITDIYNFALEARLGINNYRIKNSTTSVGFNSATQNITFGSMNTYKLLWVTGSLLFKPGIKPTDNCFIYGIMGPDFSQFKTRSSSFYSELNVGLLGLATNLSSLKKKFFRMGCALGMGLQHDITDRTSIGLEGIHTIFSNKNLTGQHTHVVNTEVNVFTERTKLKIRTSQVLVTFGYRL